MISNVTLLPSIVGHPVGTKMNFILFQKNPEITLEKLALNNHFMLAVIKDINVKSKNWYHLDRTISEGNMTENIASHFWHGSFP